MATSKEIFYKQNFNVTLDGKSYPTVFSITPNRYLVIQNDQNSKRYFFTGNDKIQKHSFDLVYDGKTIHFTLDSSIQNGHLVGTIHIEEPNQTITLDIPPREIDFIYPKLSGTSLFWFWFILILILIVLIWLIYRTYKSYKISK